MSKPRILKPVITEKSMQNSSNNEVTLEVSRSANKTQIKDLVENLYGVDVLRVRTLKRLGKRKRVGKKRREIKQNDSKKAVVRLKQGQTIEVFDTKG